MKTLFLLAGTSGSGKTTLLRKSYSNGLRIFGEKYHESFLSTNYDVGGMEYKDYEVAKARRSFFQAIHIPKLRSEESLSPFILVHMDITNILTRLVITHSEGINSCMSSDNLSAFVPRFGMDLLNHERNSVLLRNYLSDSFFSKFDVIIVNTLVCDFARNCRQLMRRNGGKLPFHEDLRTVSEIHSEMYRCWFRNLDALSPEHCFSSRVLGSNILLVDGVAVSASYEKLR